MPIKQVKLEIDYHVRYLCENSYPNHPKGCPNYRKRLSCPPGAPFIETVIDLNQPVYAIWNIFDFGSHIKKMKSLHLNWSQRQIECCLYWQGTARKQLRDEIAFWKIGLISTKANYITTCPEAMGVNITKTMESIGEILEWPPVNKTYQVAIAGQFK